MRCVVSSPLGPPSSMSSTPLVTYRYSSLRSWYWSDSASPLLTCSTLPAYRSVMAQRSSKPHGFSTRAVSTRPNSGGGMLSDSDDVLERAKPCFDGLAVRGLGVNPDQRLCPARPQQHPAAVLEVELEAVIGADSLHPD